jgi:WD40 repeat protein
MAELFRYAAFISYSSADARFAQRLHRALESYGIPASLGQFDLIGEGKKNRIYPVFRDREELSAGDLSERIEAALTASGALIVVCSPRSAASSWVEKEIQSFIKLGRKARIFAIIPDSAPLTGEDGADATPRCFPPAFCGDDLTDPNALEPLAADARKGKDGFRNAWLKIVAGLIGVTPGQLIDREKKRRRFRALQINAGAIALLSLIGFGVLRMISAQLEARSNALAQLARAAFEEGNLDRSARFARAGLAYAEWPLIRFEANAARAELRRTLAASSPRAALIGHDGAILSARFNADASRVLTRSYDGTVRVWDAVTGREILVLRSGTAQFSPDGSRIISTDGGAPAREWDAETGREVPDARWLGEGSVVAFSPNGDRIATEHGDAVRLWDVAGRREIARIQFEDDDRSPDVSFDRNGDRLMTASRTIRLWSAANGRALGEVSAPDWIIGAAFSPDGRRIIATVGARTVRVWDANTRREILVLGVPHLRGAAYNPDGMRIVTTSFDGVARVWEASTGRLAAELRGPTDDPATQEDEAALIARFSSDGSQVFVTGTDGTARAWNLDGDEVLTLRGLDVGGDVPVRGGYYGPTASFSYDGRRVLSHSGSVARIWDMTTRHVAVVESFEPVLGGADDTVGKLVLSPDGARLLDASRYDGATRLLDAVTGEEIAVLSPAQVRRAAFSLDGTRLVTASEDGALHLWDAGDGHEINVIALPTLADEQLPGHRLALAISPDGTRIITGGVNGPARVLDSSSGREVLAFEDGLAQNAVFSPDGARIGTAGGIGAIWQGSRRVRRLYSDGYVRDISFSPDGSLILVVLDTSAQIFTAGGRSLALLGGHTHRIATAAFSRDGRYIVTSSYDGTARVWDVASGHEVDVLRGHERALASAVFSPDGTQVITASLDGTVRRWALSPVLSASDQELAARACRTFLAGRSRFSEIELRAAPRGLDEDACS